MKLGFLFSSMFPRLYFLDSLSKPPLISGNLWLGEDCKGHLYILDVVIYYILFHFIRFIVNYLLEWSRRCCEWSKPLEITCCPMSSTQDLMMIVNYFPKQRENILFQHNPLHSATVHSSDISKWFSLHTINIQVGDRKKIFLWLHLN